VQTDDCLHTTHNYLSINIRIKEKSGKKNHTSKQTFDQVFLKKWQKSVIKQIFISKNIILILNSFFFFFFFLPKMLKENIFT